MTQIEMRYVSWPYKWGKKTERWLLWKKRIFCGTTVGYWLYKKLKIIQRCLCQLIGLREWYWI